MQIILHQNVAPVSYFFLISKILLHLYVVVLQAHTLYDQQFRTWSSSQSPASSTPSSRTTSKQLLS